LHDACVHAAVSDGAPKRRVDEVDRIGAEARAELGECFSGTNDPYYRHLLLLRELLGHLSIQQDLTDFCGASSRNVEWSIQRVCDIRALEDADIDFARVWYARQPLAAIPNDLTASSRASGPAPCCAGADGRAGEERTAGLGRAPDPQAIIRFDYLAAFVPQH
jgi:hypothetical protein